jgi:hypothetical protein
MPRINKKTRIRGLSPRLYLNSIDNKTGSIPSVSRLSSDNRTGRYPISFDDTKTINFHSASSRQKVILGSNTPVRFSENESHVEIFGKDFYKEGFSDEFSTGHPALKICYDFQDNIKDNSGNGYHLSPYSGSIQFDKGPTPYSRAAYFGDNTSLITTIGEFGSGYHLLSHPTSSYTFEFTCKLKTDNLSLSLLTGSSVSHIVSFGTSSGGGSGDYYHWISNDINVGFPLPTNRLIAVYGLNPGGPPVAYDFMNLAINEEDMWHHYAHVMEYVSGADGLQYDYRFYLDGELVQEQNFVSGTLWNIVEGSQLLIGDTFYYGSATYDGKYHGHISNFRLVEVALNDEQVKRSAHRNLYGSDIYVPSGSVVKGVSDTHMSFTPGQEIGPFVDSDNPASDGKSSGNSFYATGSSSEDVGEGFDGPVWSKSKIEIDLTPSAEHSFGIENFLSTSNNYSMAYWNKDLKQYQGIGSGDEFDLLKYKKTNYNGVRTFLDEKASAFPGCLIGPIMSDGMSETSLGLELPGGLPNMFAPATTFGFPTSRKYEATSSNYVEMSDYIDSPFLLEKIVLVFSGSMDINNYSLWLPYTASVAFAASTFFLINQWNAYPSPVSRSFQAPGVDAGWIYDKQDITAISQSSLLIQSSSFSTGSFGRSKTRDLVTWMQMMTHQKLGGSPINYDELVDNIWSEQHQGMIVSSSRGANWSGQYTLSGAVVSPGYYVSGNLMQVNSESDNASKYQSPEFFTSWKFPGRNMTGNTSRNYLNVIETNIEVPKVLDQPGSEYYVYSMVMPNQYPSTVDADWILGGIAKTYAKVNPYILKPGDQLIVGWEVPYSHHEQNVFGRRTTDSDPTFINVSVYDGIGPKLTFHPSPSKLILYGSKISEQKESHDTLNQILSSNAVKETLG